MSLPEHNYTSKDENGNKWEMGLRTVAGTRKFTSYIKLNEQEFVLANFNTKKSANEWWNVFKILLKKGASK